MFSRHLLAYTLFLFTLLQVGLVAATLQFPQYGKRETTPSAPLKLRSNAARMAEGYPPLKPRNFYSPSRIGARQAGASPVPYSGKVRIQDASILNYSPGYLTNEYSLETGSPAIHPANEKLIVSFFLPSSGNGPVNLAITNAGNPWPYLGIGGDDLSSASPVLVNSVVGTNPTTQNSSPTGVGNSASSYGKANSESMIWYYNTTTREITAIWINGDSSSVPVNFIHDIASRYAGLSAAGTAFLPLFPTGRHCRLYLEV